MFYKNITDYANKNHLCRQSASKRIKDGSANLIEIPKGVKFLDTEQIINYLLNRKLGK